MSEHKRTQTSVSWDDMRFFLSLSRSGQLTEAARQLGTSHVTVARRITRLEEALDQRLFLRRAKGYELTPAGSRLIETAERMETAADGLPYSDADGSGMSGSFRIAVPEAFGSYFSEHLASLFVRRFPRIVLELITMTQVMALSRREADLSVTVDPVTKGPYQSTRMVAYSLGLYAARDYLTRASPVVEREDILAHPVLSYIDGMIFSPGLDYLDEMHPTIKPMFKSSSIFNQLSATRQGLGLCILPHYIARSHSDLVPVLSETIKLDRSYWLTSHRDTSQTKRGRLIARFMFDEISKRQADFEAP